MGTSYLYLFLYIRCGNYMQHRKEFGSRAGVSTTVAEIRKSVRIRRESFAGSCEILAEITRIYEYVLSSSDSNVEGGGRDVQESGRWGYNEEDGRERR